MNEAPIRVGLVQINNSFAGLSYLPYSVGLLRAYAKRYLGKPDEFEFLLPVFERLKIADAVDKLSSADIVAFSVYVWNEQLSLAIARELKKAKPKTIIVFGGPQVLNQPDEIKEYLAHNFFIDIVCHGEGEYVFLKVLENMKSRSWQNVPSASFFLGQNFSANPTQVQPFPPVFGGGENASQSKANNDEFVQNSRIERFENLDEIPSPYLTGVFDLLIQENPQIHWIPIWETNRGCPYACTFCGWGGAVAQKIHRWSIKRLFAEVDYFATIHAEYISCADANFGILPRDIEIAEYVAMVKKKHNSFPAGFSVQNTKNAPERSIKIQKILSDNGLNRGVVLSMQSMDMQTLVDTKRSNIKLSAYRELQRRFRKEGVETMTDLIIALPGETYNSFTNGVATLIEQGQHNRIQFNNLTILPDAEMWDPAYRAKYGMQNVRSRIINAHGFRSENDEIPEYQELVIATNSMPREDWVKTRAFAWMVGFLYFNKVLQIPIVVLHELSEISYRDIIELFLFDQPFLLGNEFPFIVRMRNFFMDKAREVQDGGEEYCHSSQWLDVWWPADEYYMIELCTSGSLDAFYMEVKEVLRRFLEVRGLTVPVNAIADAVKLNYSLIKMPFLSGETMSALSWNIWEFYIGAIRGERVALVSGNFQYLVDHQGQRWNSWDEWCREVIWYGNKRGSYLFGGRPLSKPGSLIFNE